MNLFSETLAMLHDNGKAPEDVRWVQWESKFHCTWAEFAAIADFEYDNGYGGNEIKLSLYVVGDDWWLERGEYDGSEWWEFKTSPTKPEMHRTPVADDIKGWE
jgi:hypothetical protein